MERKRMPMAAWYDPGLLLRTGIRVAISTVFGEMADRREAMAAANAISAQPFDAGFDYSGKAIGGDFWLDFMADTGDGWDPTYAMAQLLTRTDLSPPGAGRKLGRGQVLVLGGDLVYPTASRDAYEQRFLYPFEEALEQAPDAAKAAMPDLYAIPGNHDWYDGLGSFFSLICRRRIAPAGSVGISRPGRPIAGRATRQTRSYFAIKLPEGWWLWGTDSQLKGYIDQPQIDFFQYVASQWMEDGSNLILCVGMPNWAYVNPDFPKKEFEVFSYLERLAGLAQRAPTEAEIAAGADPARPVSKRHQLKLVLTGDSHHYSRYVEESQAGTVHYVTCGGGGAFLHPTHQLTDKLFDWDYPAPAVAGPQIKRGYLRHFSIAAKPGSTDKAVYPDAATSRGLTRGNLSFAARNPQMTALFVAAYLLFNWLLNTNARVEGHPSLPDALAGGPWWEAPLRYAWISFASPWPSILFLAAMGGYYYFADSPYDAGKRFRIGVLKHGLVQAGTAILITSLILWLVGATFFDDRPALGVGASLLLASVVAGLVAATIFGLYLWHELNRHGRHWNEAFSALTIAGYKCFLRMRIDAGGRLHLYPIGLDRVPEGGGTPETLQPHLIEGPIEIPRRTGPADPGTGPAR